MAEANGAFVWYELMTTDADAAQQFYSNVVGWDISDSGLPGMDYRLLGAGDEQVGGILQLDQAMLDGGARPIWLGYVGVDDVDAASTEAAAAGGRVLVGPTDIPAGRFVMIADPQGIPSYVMRVTGDGPSQAFKPMADRHCAWNELATPDLASALRFYTGQFGWTLGQTMPMGDLGDYQMIERGGVPIGGVMSSAAESPPMWRFYFRVPSLERAIANIEATTDACVLHGPQEVPGDDRIIVGLDPQGAMFALVAKR